MRLSTTTLSHLRDDIRLPKLDRGRLRPRMAHLGVGAFHRAHQAVFTEDANEVSGDLFGIVGISLRSPRAEDQLNPQDGLYSVATQSSDDRKYRIISSILRVMTAPRNPGAVLDVLSSPDISVVTMTITEKGYCLDPASGELLTEQDEIAADLRAPRTPRSAIGFLTEALRRRRENGAPPFNAVSCDNLMGNGRKLRSAVLQYADALDGDLVRWIEDEVRFPMTMVDRIVPATTPEELEQASRDLGVRDEAHVRAEPFRQWVIEDDFVGARPAWEGVGADLTADVELYETAKLRLLNGAHSAIAYLGCLSSAPFVHDVMARPVFARYISELMEREVTPTLTAPEGLPLGSYAKDLRERFTNSSLEHRTAQIAMDGSQKVPVRILDTIRDRIASGKPFGRLAIVVAAWIAYVSKTSRKDLQDPLAERLKTIVEDSGGQTDALLSGFLKLREVFGNLGDERRFAVAVLPVLDQLLRGDVEAVLAEGTAS